MPTQPPKSSLSTRGLKLMWRNPRMAHTLLREEYRKKFGIQLDRRFRDGLSGPPANLNLNLTRRCNLKCVMCEQHRHASDPTGLPWYDPRRELPLSTWVGLLDQVAAFRPRLYLTGGEPTLYPHFAALLTEAKRRGFVVHLQTNGTLLDRVADSLVAQNVEMVTISMDGPQEVHDAIRGQKGAFEKTCAGIKALVAARDRRRSPGPIILINCVISKASLPTLDQMVLLAHELGADILQVQHTIFNTAANVARHNRALSPDFAAREGLDLISPSIPEGEYYESEITAADLPFLRHQLQQAQTPGQRPAQAALSAEPAPGPPGTLLPGPDPSLSPGVQRPLEGLRDFARRDHLAVPAPGGRQHQSPSRLRRSGTAPRCAVSGRSSPAASSPDASAAVAGAFPE